MTDRKNFLAFAVIGVIATAAFGYRAVAQNAEQGGAQGNEPGKMMMQCPMMETLKSLQLHADSPAVLLGQEESLELTAQQQEQLEEIAAAARQRARNVLTDEQRQQLEQAPAGPLSPMQLAKMQRKDNSGEAKGEMCPMCMKMMQQRMKQPAGEQDEPNGPR